MKKFAHENALKQLNGPVQYKYNYRTDFIKSAFQVINTDSGAPSDSSGGKEDKKNLQD